MNWMYNYCYISCLHNWLNEITKNEQNYPLLNAIDEHVRITTPLTDSAYQTANYLKKGIQY